MIKKEIKRKTIHLLFGVFFLLLIQFGGIENSINIIGLCLIAGIILSFAIMRGHKFPILNELVETVERDNEKHFPGRAAVYFFVSALILLVVFKEYPLIILAALSVQVFADSAAAIIGIQFGKHKLYKKKSYEGSLACLVVSIICINFFFPIHIAIVAGFIATAIEVLPLDDNLWVPLTTGFVIRLLLIPFTF
jgi:dolichol kinase